MIAGVSHIRHMRQRTYETIMTRWAALYTSFTVPECNVLEDADEQMLRMAIASTWVLIAVVQPSKSKFL